MDVEGGAPAPAPFTQVDAWVLVSAYFDEHGLVRQQLDSFDEFISNTVLEIVADQPLLDIRPSPQYAPGRVASASRYEVKLGDVRFSKPKQRERHAKKPEDLYPLEARLRNLTYQARLHIDVHKQAYSNVTDQPEGPPVVVREIFGDIPIMVKSQFCRLKGMPDRDLATAGECVFDQGGYFVINGSEKVVVAQERQAFNRVYWCVAASPLARPACTCMRAPCPPCSPHLTPRPPPRPPPAPRRAASASASPPSSTGWRRSGPRWSTPTAPCPACP